MRTRLLLLTTLFLSGFAAPPAAHANTPAVTASAAAAPPSSSRSWMPDVGERVASLRERMEQSEARQRGRVDDRQRAWWRERVVELPPVVAR
jgi:hypothetical protein